MTSIRNLAFAGAVSAAFAFAAPALAATLDDFNRADTASLGAGWTQVSGVSGVAGNQAYGSSAALATFNGGSSNTVSFDIFSTGTGTQYGAAVIGWGSAESYFIKLQNNGGGSTGFNHFGFYSGNNGAAGSGPFGDLSAAFESAHVTVSVVGTLATLTITPDVGAVQVYTHNYATAFSGGATGLGFYGATRIDNFADAAVSAVPEPATWAMMIGGFGLAGAALRRRRGLAVTA